jgi:hypothetical protein
MSWVAGICFFLNKQQNIFMNSDHRSRFRRASKGSTIFCFFSSRKRKTALAALLLLAPTAQAQSIGDLLPIAVPGFAIAPGVTALSRLHQSNQVNGIKFGIFPDDLIIYPSVTAGAGLDTAPSPGQSATAITSAQPAVRITDAALGLVAFASADISRYPADATANATDITAGLGLAVPIGAATVTLGAARIMTQETALGTVQSGAAAPFGVALTEERSALRLPLGAFDLTTRITLSDAALSRTGGDAPVPFRNRADFDASSELATATGGVLRLLTQVNLSATHYTGALFGAELSNATSIGWVGGVETAATGVVRLRAVAGMAYQQFAAPSSASIIPIGSIGLGWTPDGLISAEFDVSRQTGADTTLGTQGTPVTSAHGVVANEFTRDTVLRASLDARTGTVVGHQAREIDLAVGATWHWSRQFALVPSLSDAIRHNVPGSAPHEARAMLSLTWAP